MDRGIIYVILFLNFIVAIAYFIRKNNEVPFFLALFNSMVEYRIVSLESGKSRFVSFDYGIDFRFDMEYAYIASNLILLGTTVMLYSYILFFNPQRNKVKDNNELLKRFVVKNRTSILAGLGFFSLLTVALSGSDTGSYSFLTKLGNTSFIIMLFLVMHFTQKNATAKLMYGVLFLFLGYLTYSTSVRFQFLGWIITIGYFLVRNIRPTKKVVFAITGIFAIMVIFSFAGVLRYNDPTQMTLEEMYDASVERLEVAEDINFIDGFMMLYQVYPKYLDFEMGLQHLQILIRPIPRALWPGKPQASWVREYQEKHNGEVLESAGFSPTIWGVFYSELGIAGIVILSIAWAWLLSYLYRAFSIFSSDLSYILVGALLSSLIPIFRSGDMAGDFAIVLMSFWPLFVFVRRYKKFVQEQLKIQRYKKLAVHGA
jgi:hypothetical protein